jgi:subfamily B ATP-binding cassette protein MsbA
MFRSRDLVIYGRLLQITRKYWILLVIGMLMTLSLSGIDATFAWFIQPIINKGFISKDIVFVRWLPILVIIFFIARGLSHLGSTYCVNYVARSTVTTLRRQLFNHLLRLPASFHDHHDSGNLLSAVIYNVDQVASASADVIIIGLREISLMIGLLVVMFLTNWIFTLFFLVLAPVIFWIMKRCNTRVRRFSTMVQQTVGEVAHQVSEALGAYRLIRINGGESIEELHFRQITQKNRHSELKVILTGTINTALVQLVLAIPIATLLFLAAKPNLGVNAGNFIAFVSSMLMMLRPMRRLTAVNLSIQKGIAAAASIFKTLDEPPEKDIGQYSLNRAKGAIVYKQVSFRYPHSQNKVLENINFDIKPGQTIAIVGRSGSGKSSLVHLLPRFYEPAMGNITIDNIDIQHLHLSDLRKQLAFVSQNMMLFNDTIANNIIYGHNQTYDEKTVIAAAEAAQAMDFIDALPKGIHTLVGENGVLLSGGQCQRIAIARALFKNAPILILDEPTSSLDQHTEQAIQRALKTIMAQCTTLVIAHRLSTIEKADCILVLDQGRLVEQGSHTELLNSNGAYKNLYSSHFDTKNQNLEVMH